MNVLVGCEFSGIVRDAFRERGHNAWSCDLLPTDRPGQHIQGDVSAAIKGGHWDLAIFHPPCTYLCSSGLHWNKRRPERELFTDAAVEFVRLLLAAPIEHIALENPIGCLSTRIRKPDQIIQPFEYGEPFRKATCLWLKNLPQLIPTCVMKERKQQCWLESPGPDRWKRRSKTYQGIANAMAEQWSRHTENKPQIKSTQTEAKDYYLESV